MKIIGIDIGSFSIKVAEVHLSGKTATLVQCFEHVLSLDPTHDKSILILDFLRNLTQNHDPESTKYVFSLSQDKVSLRHKTFPFRERQKILKSLPFELEDEIPLEQMDTIYEGKIISWQGSQSDVLCCACPKEHLQKVLRTASDGGIDPDIVTLEGLALNNLFCDWLAPPPEVKVKEQEERGEDGVHEKPIGMDHSIVEGKLLVNIGHSQTLVLIYRDELLISIRTIAWGCRDVIESVARSYKIQFVEAIKEVQAKAFVLLTPEGATQNQIHFSQVIAGSLSQLTRELKLTMVGFASSQKIRFTKVGFLGGGSQIRNLGPFLTQELEIAANPLDPLKTLKHLHVSPGFVIPVQSGVAIGLAIEALKKPKNPSINFRKAEFVKRNETFRRLVERWGYTAKLIAAGFVIFFVYAVVRSMIAESLRDEAEVVLKDKAAAIANLKGTSARMSNVTKYIKSERAQIENRKKLVQLESMNSAMEVLASISRIVPQQTQIHLDVKKADLQWDRMRMEGTVDSQQEFEMLKRSIEGFAVSNKVKVLQSSSRPGQKFQFALEFGVDRKMREAL